MGWKTLSSVVDLPIPNQHSGITMSQSQIPPEPQDREQGYPCQPPEQAALWGAADLCLPSRTAGQLNISSCSQTKKELLYGKAREAFASLASTPGPYYCRIRPYLGRCFPSARFGGSSQPQTGLAVSKTSPNPPQKCWKGFAHLQVSPVLSLRWSSSRRSEGLG